MFKKRNVFISVNNYLKEINCFIGTLTLLHHVNKTFQEILIEESLVYCDKKNIINNDYPLI